jgi:hypothetical protein
VIFLLLVNFSKISSGNFLLGGPLLRSIDFLWVLENFVGSIALGLDWSGKSMNHFVGWGFFPVGGLNSLGQPSSVRRANFQEVENETCPGSFFCWILESNWNS